MQASEAVVIDYGIGNLLSVRRGLERCGARVLVTDDPSAILAAPRVVLPGVGAFADGMAGLDRRGLSDIVRDVASQGTPLLGICLGMQMLLDESVEFGVTRGLGLIHGRVIQVPAVRTDGFPQKIPHIGWNALRQPASRSTWEGTLLEGVPPGSAMYFVHSFMANPTDPRDRLADCDYGGIAVSAMVASGNIIGCQFHPEKSGRVGLEIMRAFLALERTAA
jgi:glutamine amidotransferase